MDPDFEVKLSAIPVFGDRIKYFTSLFKLYVADPVLQTAAALLVFEHDITPEIMARFSDQTTQDVMNMAVGMLGVEKVNSLVAKTNSLTNYYHDGNCYTAPWDNFPDFGTSAIKTVLVQNGFDVALNVVVDRFPELVREYVLPENSLIGSFVMAASMSFNVDYSLSMLRDLMVQYGAEKKQRGEIFILGKNTHTPYQMLGMKEARLVVVRSNDDVFSEVKKKEIDVVVYNDPNLFVNHFVVSSSQLAVVFDTVVHEQMGSNLVGLTNPAIESMSSCFGMAQTLLGKVKKNTPEEHHALLPLTLVMHFTPDFRAGGGLSSKNLMGALVHHYDLRYLPPVDFVGMDFTVYCVKRKRPIKKQHINTRHPYEIFKSFVFHTLVMRYLVLSRIKENRVSWKCLAPMRMLSRYHGIGSRCPKFRVQDLVNYADWGGTYLINDYNNFFSGETERSLFSVTPVTLSNGVSRPRTASSKKKGVSKHLDHNLNAMNMLKSVQPVYGAIRKKGVAKPASGSPFFFKDMQAAKGEAF